MNGLPGPDPGGIIRSWRKKRGLKQKVLGERVGVSKSEISRYEKNAEVPDEDRLELIIGELQIPPIAAADLREKCAAARGLQAIERNELFPVFYETIPSILRTCERDIWNRPKEAQATLLLFLARLDGLRKGHPEWVELPRWLLQIRLLLLFTVTATQPDKVAAAEHIRTEKEKNVDGLKPYLYRLDPFYQDVYRLLMVWVYYFSGDYWRALQEIDRILDQLQCLRMRSVTLRDQIVIAACAGSLDKYQEALGLLQDSRNGKLGAAAIAEAWEGIARAAFILLQNGVPPGSAPSLTWKEVKEALKQARTAWRKAQEVDEGYRFIESQIIRTGAEYFAATNGAQVNRIQQAASSLMKPFAECGFQRYSRQIQDLSGAA